MSKRSQLKNMKAENLYIILEQKQEKLDNLLSKNSKNPLKERSQVIFDIKRTIFYIRQILKDRIIKAGVSSSELTQIIAYTDGIKADIFKEIFTEKIMETEGLIGLVDIGALEKALDKLTIDQIWDIAKIRSNGLIVQRTKDRLDEIFDKIEEDYEDMPDKIGEKRIGEKKNDKY